MFEKVKNYALLASVGIILCLAAFAAFQGRKLSSLKEEADRLSNNQAALLSKVREETNRSGQLQATVDALTMRRDELENLVPALQSKLRIMGIRLKDAQTAAQVATETAAQVTAVPDTVIRFVEAAPGDSARRFCYEDQWLRADILLQGDSAAVSVSVLDSLTIVAHKERRRCLFRRPRITHYTAVPSSPYTRVVGLSYIEITEN